MASFDLTIAGTKYSLADDGNVSTSAGLFGTWNTDGKTSNQIIITPKAGGAAIAAPAVWKFNENNQLCLMNGATELFNFSTGARPVFRMDNGNILHVAATGGAFEFALICTFAADDDMDLLITIGTTVSTLVGTPDSNAAQFAYSFSDKVIAGPSYWLPFTGEWKRDTSEGENDIRLVFQGTAGGKPFAIKMPSGATLSGKNQLFVSGFKNGEAWGIEIQSTLVIQKNFTMVFTLSQQKTPAGVKTTSIVVKAVFVPNETTNLAASLDLYVTNQTNSTDNSRKVSVTGKGHVTFGGTGLDITFAYSKSSIPGQQAVVAAAIGTSFSWNSGKNALAITFKQDGGTKSVTLTSNFTLKDKVRIQTYLNVTQGPGKKKGVYAALGIAF